MSLIIIILIIILLLLVPLLLLLLHPFNGLFSRTTWVSCYQKGKSSLDLKEARDDGILGCSGVSWSIVWGIRIVKMCTYMLFTELFESRGLSCGK